jgi:hypothetical protein
MSNLCNQSVTSGFIDLASFDELEKYMYGGKTATAYFVRDTRKSTWFTQVPVPLSRASGQPGFGTEHSVSISRAGDYLLHTWLRLTTPEIVTSATFRQNPNRRIRWTRYFMHNLINECCITFNDLVAARFDNYHLDFWAAFTVPAGKRTGYNNMVGNFNELTNPKYEGIPSFTLNLPLPFFFSRDSGVALPTAALPYNDMRINFSFRDWTQLLVVDDNYEQVPPELNAVTDICSRCATINDVEGKPELSNVQVWANYAIVSNTERKKMACAPRDMLVEQVQTAPRCTFAPEQDCRPRYDIRFSHAIKALFFSARNTTSPCEWSNYTAGQPQHTLDEILYNSPSLVDNLEETSLIYENTARLSQMGSDYFSLVNPFYHAPHIPIETGYHMYSYSLDFVCLDPMGSTNYGKLTNVSIHALASEDAKAYSNPLNFPQGIATEALQADFIFCPQTYDFIVTAVNNNIIRVSGGALGFPVL